MLLAHYGLDAEVSISHDQIGQRLGISSQRARQIERDALAKLRAAAESNK